MEDIPPSYDQSVNPSVLDTIAPYLDTLSLHALALVSRSFNATFMPHLWGSPASHFVAVTGPTTPGISRAARNEASYDDMVYVALTRFKKILKIARLSTRRLVHTLFLPPAASEIYSGPNSTWLKEILDGLPNLQSLCVSGLPFFDHHSLIAVDRHRLSQADQGRHKYPVKLLLAAKEPNTTSIGLSNFLPHLDGLVYLDLSYTTAARDANVLSSLVALSDLQILKLRGIGLRDMEAEVLANAIGLRVRLLDVADNQLGDMAIRSLLQACFVHPATVNLQNGAQPNGSGNARPQLPHPHSRRHLESWPVGMSPAPDFLSLDTLRSVDFDKNLLLQLTHPLTGRLAFEDIPHGGITHLYIGGNQAVTVEGIRSLLRLGRLFVLDAGDISGETEVDKYIRNMRDTDTRFKRTMSIQSVKSARSSSASNPDSLRTSSRGDDGGEDFTFSNDNMHLPGAEKLIPILREKSSKNLTYLRIEHKVVTKASDVVKGNGFAAGAIRSDPVAELSSPSLGTGRPEAPGSNYQPVELPSYPDVFELDSTVKFRAELPGDPIHFAISPPVGERPLSEVGEMQPKALTRGEGAFAPEVVVKDAENEIPADAVEGDASGVRPRSPALSRSSSPTSPSFPNHSAAIDSVIAGPQRSGASGTAPSVSNERRTQIQRLLKSRPPSLSPKLHPSSLPNLRTLVLTNLPAQVASTSSPIVGSIKDFISACATEAYIAVLRAQTNYSLPPGRARVAAEREHALSLFALQTLVLEVSPAQDVASQRDWKHTRQRLNISKSSTGDRDSEAFWSAAENDFSFFSEEGEEQDECGIYAHEPGKYFPSVHLDDKFAVTADDVSSSASGSHSPFSTLSSANLHSPTGTMFRSPRELPLGRNRRISNDHRVATPDSTVSSTRFGAIELPGRLAPMELPGSIPVLPNRPTTIPKSTPKAAPVMVDLVSELSKWRKERKAAYEEEVRRRARINGVTVLSRIADAEIYVEGHWKGEIKVIRNSAPAKVGGNRGIHGRSERTGMVDIYGNYFEKGYLYS